MHVFCLYSVLVFLRAFSLLSLMSQHLEWIPKLVVRRGTYFLKSALVEQWFCLRILWMKLICLEIVLPSWPMDDCSVVGLPCFSNGNTVYCLTQQFKWSCACSVWTFILDETFEKWNYIHYFNFPMMHSFLHNILKMFFRKIIHVPFLLFYCPCLQHIQQGFYIDINLVLFGVCMLTAATCTIHKLNSLIHILV